MASHPVFGLGCAESAGYSPPDVELLQQPAAFLSKATKQVRVELDEVEWLCQRDLPDGSMYLAWWKLAEFVVSADGRRIAGAAFVRSDHRPRVGSTRSLQPKLSGVRLFPFAGGGMSAASG